MAETRIQTRITEDTYAWLEEREQRMHTGSPHVQARVELAMWAQVLREELRRIQLSLAQANCLGDVLNGNLMSFDSAHYPAVLLEAQDAFALARENPHGEDTYGHKWDLDEEQLISYLKTLRPAAAHALHDAISRWWATNKEPTVAGWAAVGLKVTDPSTNPSEGRRP